MAKIPKITPFLWFDKEAEEAANFYVSIFKKSSINKVIKHGNSAFVVQFKLAGQAFTSISAGPMYKMNPSISFFIMCNSVAETKSVWKKLAKGGKVLIPLEKQMWSESYGWVQDKFGLSWQINIGNKKVKKGEKFMPSFLFSGEQKGKAEQALNFYQTVFDKSSTTEITRYQTGGQGPVGSLMYGQFVLYGQTFAAMDNPMAQDYKFPEAITFVINCKGQKEVDYYWEKLLADGGKESMCAWLHDKYGVTWQVVPDALTKLLEDPDPAVAQRAMMNMMQMKKIVIRQLSREPKKVNITVKATINAPVEKAWKAYITSSDVEKWNHAGDDWYCPKASNEFKKGGSFSYIMAAKDGSFSFDFSGIFDEIVENQRITITLGDGRKMSLVFKAKGKKTEVIETFEAENMNSHNMQRGGWQMILDNYKKHTESI
jgi:predicted 3-demethylubiquinone-9 3-methyltransferase (glyoxalase superfamily)/uncharacterized protein YndB with AHSA1/START domain